MNTKVFTIQWRSGEELLTIVKPGVDLDAPEEEKEPPIIKIDGEYEEWQSIPHGSLSYNDWNGPSVHDVALATDDEIGRAHV